MSDDLNKKGEADRVRINSNEKYEVYYWSKKFKLAKEALIAAVKKAGPLVKNVKRLLGL